MLQIRGTFARGRPTGEERGHAKN